MKPERGPMFRRYVRKTGAAAKAELANIVKLRRLLDLEPIRSGERMCLSCEVRFFSEDLVNQKCCDYCRRER